MITVRAALAEDAELIARMAEAMHAFHGDPGGFDAAVILADGFGERSWFDILIAERDGAAVGYALFHPSYDSGNAARGVYLNDLWVAPDHRRAGVAQALLRGVAEAGRAKGAVFVWLAVQPWNTEALAFYDRVGAIGETVAARAFLIDAMLDGVQPDS